MVSKERKLHTVLDDGTEIYEYPDGARGVKLWCCIEGVWYHYWEWVEECLALLDGDKGLGC